MRKSLLVPLCLSAFFLGCTVHPRGEFPERQAATQEAKPYVHPIEKRELPPLPADATPDQLVTHALLASGDVEQKYWQWVAAIEQIPQEGTQKANLALSYSTMITNANWALANNALGAGSDPMSNLVLPNKLGAAAQVALDDARAARKRFDQARFELRAKVLTAWYDYALTAERLRLLESNSHLLEISNKLIQSRVATTVDGGGMQQDLLKIANEIDLAANDIAMTRAKLPIQRAALNALLNRSPDAEIDVPAQLPTPRGIPASDAELLALAAKNNPELQAMAEEIQSSTDAIARARLEYLPDFSISASTDLAGIAQSLFAGVSLPYLRHESLDAAIRQATANRSAAEAALYQARSNLAARIVADLLMLRDDERQIALFEKTIVPRAERIVTSIQGHYATSHATLIDLLDAERSLIALRRAVAELRIDREKQLADLESATAISLSEPAPSAK